MISEESATPDVVDLTRRSFAAGRRHDVDATMSFYAPDAVWDLSDVGIGTFEGTAAIRSFVEDWWETWGDHLNQVEEAVGLGNGVVFVSLWEEGRLLGSDAYVQQRRGWVFLWATDLAKRVTVYLDIDEARAAAARLAEERG